LSATTMRYLREWSEKTGRPLDELLSDFNKRLAEIRTAHPQLKPEVAEARARFLVYRELKAALRFPGAVTFDVLFLGYNAPMDVFARRRRDALDLWQRDPAAAVAQGFTNSEGRPIFKLPSGATIDISEPILLRQCVGIGRPAEGGDLRWVVLLQRRELVNILPPLKTPVRFTGVKRGEVGFRYSLSMTRLTKFEPVTMPEFTTLDDASICELLRAAPADTRVTCSGLREWHNRFQGDRERICVVEGDAVFIRPEPTAIGNQLMVIEDETMMDLEAEGITVWIHQGISNMLDFGAGSRILVIGRTTTMPGWDRATRQIDRSVTRIGINAMGIYADPLFKISPTEATVFRPEVVVE